MRKIRRLLDEYRFPGFRPKAEIKGIFGKPGFRVIQLERRQKKRFVDAAVRVFAVITIRNKYWSGIYPVVENRFIWQSGYGELCVPNVGK